MAVGTTIPHEVMEALCKVDITMRQMRILMFVFRKTYGWHKEQDWISRQQIAEAIDCNHINNVSSDLVTLRKLNMIFVDGSKIGPNSDPDTWKKSIEIKTKSIKNDTPESRNQYSDAEKKYRNQYSKVSNSIPESIEINTHKYRNQYSNKSKDTNTKISNTNITPQTPQGDVDQNPAMEVFEYWVQTLRKPANTKFTKGRRQKIQARIRDGYSIDQIKSAIDGCKNSKYHQGGNDQGKVYDCLTLICRSGEKLEQFIGYNQRAGPEQTRSAALQAWIDAGQTENYTAGETFENGQY